MDAADRSLFTPISRDVRARAALYLSVVLSYLAAVQNDPLAGAMVLVFFLASLWSLGFEHRFLRPFFPSVMKIGLIVTGSAVFIAFFLTGLARPAETFANAIARFLFWNATVFVLSRNKTEYDVWTLGIIDVSLFMISGAFVQPPAFLLLFLASLVCALYAFQRLALLRCGPAGEQASHGPGILLVQATVVVEIAALVFFFFPRQVFPSRPATRGGAPGEEEPIGPDVATGGGDRRTGLANPNELALESMRGLKNDLRVALKMRATAASEQSRYTPGQPVYLRGATYERYERGTWHANYEPREQAANAEGWIVVRPDVRRPDELHQTIVAVPAGGDAVVCAGEPMRFKTPKARYDAGGTFFFVDRHDATVEYAIVGAFVPDAAERDIRQQQPARVPRLVELPAGLDRLRAKAREVTARERTAVDRVIALRQWLHHEARLTYSMAAFAAPAGADPVEHFVFEKREGYCMHFASALTLMLRAIGIPARLVGGYHAKDYDWAKQEYIVRHMDAHAWVEVPFAGQGWVRFDCTPEDTTGLSKPPELPAVPTGEDPQKKAEEEAKRKKEDLEKQRWDRYLVDYDPGAQASAARSLVGAVGGFIAAVARFVAQPLVALLIGLLALAAFVGYLLLPREHKQRLRQVLGGFRDRSSVDFYRDFLWLASKRGVTKSNGLTGREFAAIAALKLPADAVSLLTDAFYEVRYGGRPLSGDDRKRVRKALAAIEKSGSPGPQVPGQDAR